MAKLKEKKEKEKTDAPKLSPFEQMRAEFTELHGKNSLITLAEDNTSSVSEWIHSGSIKLDEIISNGKGLPIGKIITINGKKSSGKSTIAAHIMAQAQQLGAITVYLDTEYAFDKKRAEQLGVDTSNIYFCQPDCLEECITKIESIIDIAAKTNTLTVIVWDSVAATPTRSEIEGEVGDGGNYGEHSKIISKGFRRITQKVASNRILLFLVNQIKVDVAGYGGVTYIAKNPLDFHSHVMIEIRQKGMIKEGDEIVGIESDVKVSKNRVAAPFKEAVIKIRFADGIDWAGEILDISKGLGRARPKGSWNEILTECLDCSATGKLDGKRCEVCEGSGKIQHPSFKNFYAKDFRSMLEENPGLKEYLLNGTPVA